MEVLKGGEILCLPGRLLAQSGTRVLRPQHLAPERATLESAEKALEAERSARSKADREVLALQGRVMETEDMSAWLRE